MTTELRFKERTVRADGLLSSPAEVNQSTRGGTATLRLLNPSDALVVRSGETHTVPTGETETFDRVIIETNATLTVDGTLEVFEFLNNDGTVDNNGVITFTDGEKEDLLKYQPFAGKFTVTETLASEQTFRERLPDDAEVSSLLVRFVPDTDLQDRQIGGVYGLIDGVTDSRPAALSQDEIEVTVRVLANSGEYSSLTDAENDLAV